MRVAYVCTDPGVPVFGTKGCSIHVAQIVRAFIRQGWQVDLYARRFEGQAPSSLHGIRQFPLQRVSRSLNAEQRELRLIELDRSLALTLRQNGPYELVYERHALWSAAGTEFALDEGIPSILEVNAPLLEEQAKYRELIAVERAHQIMQRSFSSAKTIIAVSGGVADYVRKVSPQNTNHLHVVHNGVDVRAFTQSAEAVSQRWVRRLAGKREPVVVGFVGTLRAWHGMSTLGRAFRQFRLTQPTAKLLVVGDGPARDELMSALGIEAATHTAITGTTPHNDIPSIMARIDIAIAPYPGLDNFYFSPLKILEYMACGLPIVSSRIGDIPRLLENGRYGMLVAPGSASALSEAIFRIAGDPITAIELGQDARAAAARHHDWDLKLSQILSLARASAAPSATVRSAG